VVAAVAVMAAVSQLRTASRLRRELADARADAARAEDAERRAQNRTNELSRLLDAATAPDRGEPDGDGLWQLLLAYVSRRWAGVVGVTPDGRALRARQPDEQLVEALGREIERLREEVGVDVEMTANAGAGALAAGADAAERVAVLIATLELLGALATTAQRVAVDVGDTLVLTGDGWVDPYGEVVAAHRRADGAGVVLGPLESGDEHVRLVVHHRPSLTAAGRARPA
jgi:hypothetical protein